MTNTEPKFQTADLSAQCFYTGNKRREKSQQLGWQMSGCCLSPPFTWQPEASGPLGLELNGGGGIPGPLDDRLGTILHLLVMPMFIALKSPLLYIP